MKITALIEALVAADATPQMILAAVRTVESQDTDALEQGRAKARARFSKWKAKKAANVSQRLPTVSNALVTPVEDKTSNLDIEPQESKKQKTAQGGVVEFKARLSSVLDADLLDAFVAVRKTKRGALTGYAAGLFIADAERCGMSVPDAAKECVRSSWITVKPEYFHGRPRAGPAPQAPSLADVFAVAARTPNNEIEPEPQEDRSGFRAAIPYLSAVRSG